MATQDESWHGGRMSIHCLRVQNIPQTIPDHIEGQDDNENGHSRGDGKPRLTEELIDAIIRILHLLSALDLDAEKLYQKKMAKNWERPYRYGTVRGG